MKSVLISIQPQYVEKICAVVGEENGKLVYKKKIEVRKTVPKLKTPFKCYIYCTNGQMLYDLKEETYLDTKYRYAIGESVSNKVVSSSPPFVNRKVIGEFVCDRISDIFGGLNDRWALDLACLSEEEAGAYLGRIDTPMCYTIYGIRRGYGWHISDLKIYDKPKELSEFNKFCYVNSNSDCYFCDQSGIRGGRCFGKVYRAPQSWCYVEG